VWSGMRSLSRGPVPIYDLAPDGKRFALVLNPDGTAEEKPIKSVMVLLNFFDELRRRAPGSKWKAGSFFRAPTAVQHDPYRGIRHVSKVPPTSGSGDRERLLVSE